MSLDNEIREKRAEVRSDTLSMSIGELISLYKDKEIDIHPEFQRFYRWTPYQKSRFIESILLTIPIPSIFVSQRQDGIWDVIDGLQRLSTIYELVGELRDDQGKVLGPLTLTKTKYLPSLEGKRWEEDGSGTGLGTDTQLLIRRSKIDVKIILRESTEATKYELFQRLNSGGSLLSDQELRNAALLMINQDAYRWLEDLAEDEDFLACLPISQRQIEQQFHLELVTRFVIFRKRPPEQLSWPGDLRDFLTDQICEMAQVSDFEEWMKTEEKAFRFTFSHLACALGEDSFKKYDTVREKHQGAVLMSAFELIAMGLGYNSEKYDSSAREVEPDRIIQLSKEAWSNLEFTSNSGSGIGVETRLKANIPLGRSIFSPCQ